MRLVLISDTHNRHNGLSVPDGDVLIHAGDLTVNGSLSELKDACYWLNKQPHEHKLAIAGNHDWACFGFYQEKHEDILRTDFFKDVRYLRDSGWEIDGWQFWGSPWTPEFCGWAFNRERSEMYKGNNLIAANTDVLITHGPPAGHMDEVKPFPPKYPRVHSGCDNLRQAVADIQPRVHVFGHIHSGYGTQCLGRTLLVNAAVVDEKYRLANAPVVFDLVPADRRSRFDKYSVA